MVTTPSITAIGPLCGQLQEPIHRVRAAVDALGIQPAMRINGVPHFSEADCERIADHLREERQRGYQVFKHGPQDGLKIECSLPAVGESRDAYFYDKATKQTHLYRGIFKGGRKLIVRHVGIVPAAACPVHQALMGEG